MVRFSSTDPQATLPADVLLTNGVGFFPITMRTASETQTLSVTDTLKSDVTGSTVLLVNPADAHRFVISTGQSLSGDVARVA